MIEQKRIIRAAINANAEALVIECMALQPLLQSVCELQLVRSTHGVITNARADHLDVMGPTRLDVAHALSGTVPIRGELFTAENRADSIAIMRHAAEDRGSVMNVIRDVDRAAVTEEELAKFPYVEHAENVALALRVCQSIGVCREDALREMWLATPDPGAMKVHRLMVDNCQWSFVNGFAANDPESTAQLWSTACDRFGVSPRRVLIMNCRVDRPDRSTTMGRAIADWPEPDQIVVIGTGTDMFLRAAISAGVNADRIVCLGEGSCDEIAETVAEYHPHVGEATESASDVMLMGIGNVAGPGFKLDHFFQTHPAWDSQRYLQSKSQPSVAAASARQLDLIGVS